MKLVLFACLAAVAMATPQFQDLPIVQVLRQEQIDHDGTGNFNYVLETDNGIFVAASGSPGSQGQANYEGVYSLPNNEGGFSEVRFIADEFGFQPQSDLLPVAPPAPAHVAELLEIAEQQRAAGVVFE